MKPSSRRPFMPGYGILHATKGKGLLPWTWARQLLQKSHNYWVSTSRPDGRPHTMAVWGVWAEDKFYFSTGGRSRKARNLARNPRCVVCTERADEAVIVEGTAGKTRASSLPKHVSREYKTKYNWALDPKQGPIFAVRPGVAFGFIEAPDKFAKTATRWTFTTEHKQAQRNPIHAKPIKR